MNRKICVVTGTRAEYGLLNFLMKEIAEDEDLELQIIATGMHLSPEFGLTYKDIEKEFKIDKKIEMLLSSDTQVGISKSMGLAQISFADAYEDLKPVMDTATNAAEFYLKRLITYIRNNTALYPKYNTNTGADLDPNTSAYFSGIQLEPTAPRSNRLKSFLQGANITIYGC